MFRLWLIQMFCTLYNVSTYAYGKQYIILNIYISAMRVCVCMCQTIAHLLKLNQQFMLCMCVCDCDICRVCSLYHHYPCKWMHGFFFFRLPSIYLLRAFCACTHHKMSSAISHMSLLRLCGASEVGIYLYAV